jgi:hypothetical protein
MICLANNPSVWQACFLFGKELFCLPKESNCLAKTYSDWQSLQLFGKLIELIKLFGKVYD